MCVQINYKKLWIKLAELEMDKAEFRKGVDLSPNTMTNVSYRITCNNGNQRTLINP